MLSFFLFLQSALRKTNILHFFLCDIRLYSCVNPLTTSSISVEHVRHCVRVRPVFIDCKCGGEYGAGTDITY